MPEKNKIVIGISADHSYEGSSDGTYTWTYSTSADSTWSELLDEFIRGLGSVGYIITEEQLAKHFDTN